MAKIAFDEFEIDLALGTLDRSGEPVEIGPRPLKALLFLIENRHRFVDRETLREHVWQGAALSTSAIPTAILAVRRALGDDPNDPRYLMAKRGRGYRFVGRLAGRNGVAVRADPDRVEALPFVGREEEIRYLQNVLRQVEITRSGQLVFVSADGGMGKSRLLDEFRTALAGEVPAYFAHPSPSEIARPFLPWTQILRKAASTAEPASRLRSLAGALATEAWEFGAGLEEDRPADRSDRFKAFQRWAEAICALSERGPAALFMDDVHRLDPDSLLLLYWIADELESHPLLIVASLRPQPGSATTNALIDDILDLPNSTSLVLAPLEVPEVERLLDPSHPNARSLARDLIAETSGNAFLLSHLLRSLTSIPNADADPRAIERLPLLAHQIVTRQLSDLPERTRGMLATASVLGDQFECQALCHTAQLSFGAVYEALQPAIDSWIVSEEAGRFRFRHSILRESLYRTLPPIERKTAHLRFADYLSQQPASTPRAAEISHHLASSLPVGPLRSNDGAKRDAVEPAPSRPAAFRAG